MRRFALCASVLVVVVCSAAAVWGEETHKAQPGFSISVNGLAGLREANILVETLDTEGRQRTGLRVEQLKKTLTAAVLGSGTVKIGTTLTTVPVPGSEAVKLMGDKNRLVPATIYLRVPLLSLDKVGSTVYVVHLSLSQTGYVLRPDGQWLWVPGAMTWRYPGYIGIAPDNEVAQKVKDIIRDAVDQFTIDYFKENPQPAAVKEEAP